MFLEDGNFEEADEYCEKVLDMEPENAEAYLGKLMAEFGVRRQEGLKNLEKPFDNNSNYQKVIRFAGSDLSDRLKGYITYINNRNERARLEGIYNDAINEMNNAKDIIESMKSYKYRIASEKFETIIGYKDSETLARKCLEEAEVCRKDSIYTLAKLKMEEHTILGYEAAIKEFQDISGWKDTAEQINICKEKIAYIQKEEEAAMITLKRQRKIMAIGALIVIVGIIITVVVKNVIIPQIKYNEAVSIYNDGNYDEAMVKFQELGNYKDSQQYIKELKYIEATTLYNNGNYSEAMAKFQELGNYKDSYTLYLKSASVGDSILFGSYEQDDDTSNGKEDVEWIVLAKEDNRALLISKYALDSKEYNTEDKDITWETCSLRNWLNNDFLNEAFNTEEQARIITTDLSASPNPQYSTNPGNPTQDRVFLLGIDEVNSFFHSDEERQCSATPYAEAQGDYIIDGRWFWWLRSPGYNQDDATFVNDGGSCDYDGEGVDDWYTAVRPALWISLD